MFENPCDQSDVPEKNAAPKVDRKKELRSRSVSLQTTRKSKNCTVKRR